MMQRRQFAGLLLAAPIAVAGCSAQPKAGASDSKFSYLPGIRSGKPLIAPKGRQIKVAFAINPGFQVIDIKVQVTDGSFHEVDSNELAFKMAGIFALKDAFKKANPILLEPIMKVEVATPEKTRKSNVAYTLVLKTTSEFNINFFLSRKGSGIFKNG